MVEFEISRDCNSVIPLQFDIENLFLKRPELEYKQVELNTLKPTNIDYDIIIIGGGLSSCYISCQLKATLNALKILIIDENKHFLESFTRRTDQIGQETLRSPYSHQIAPDGFIQLVDYARLHSNILTRPELYQIELARMGQRSIVPRDIFLKHCYHTIRSFGLKYCSYKDKVVSISKNTNNKYLVKTQNGTALKATSIILASGQLDKRVKYSNSINCYEYKNNLKYISNLKNILVIGSGLSSGYVIYDLIKRGIKPSWHLRDKIQIKCADIPTKYFREEGFNSFDCLPFDAKIEHILELNKGSLMPEYERFLRESILNKNIKIVKNIESNKYDCIIECNGLVQNTDLLNGISLIKEYPTVNEDLEVAKGFFVIGINATLEIGVAAKNIDGFRLASEKILPKIFSMFNYDIECNSYKRLITGKRKVL